MALSLDKNHTLVKVPKFFPQILMLDKLFNICATLYHSKFFTNFDLFLYSDLT